MTNVNPYSTQVAQGQSQAQAVLAGNGKGVFSGAAGQTFWDFLLGGTPTTVTQTDNPLLPLTQESATTPADLMALSADEIKALLADLESVEGIEGIEGLNGEEPVSLMELGLFLKQQDGVQTTDLINLRVERIQKHIDQMNKLVNHLTNGMPASTKNDALIDTLISRLDIQIEKLETKLQEMQTGKFGEGDLSVLIALGLTPAQLTKMTQRIEEVEKKLGRELTVEDLVAGVANIVPPPEEPKNLIVFAGTGGEASDLTNLPEDAQPTDALAAQLNGLTVGVGNNGDDLHLGDEGIEGGADKKVMRGLDLLQKLMTSAQGMAAGNAQKAGEILKSGFSSLLNLAGVSGDIALPSSWYQSPSDGITMSSFDIHAGIPGTSAAQAAHAATAVQQAGQVHPATQIVSAHLTKAAQEGAPKSMTIQLDPPELGRVDIRLEFGSDSTVKAHLIVEKIETFHMLQRDAAYLDRALQNAGLDTAGGNSLSFELAHDDSSFDQKDSNGNGSDGNGSEKRADGDADLIQSTMTWQVDPDSGHVRYNIFA
jgi:hypothetical protein